MRDVADYLILGAGVTGLAAAEALGSHAIVLEREDRPGGLLRTECFGGYWFDRVLHLLYFADEATAERIGALLGDDLHRCRPTAWVETDFGTVRFPFQMHLRGLEPGIMVRCLHDLAEVSFHANGVKPSNFEELLLHTFGRGMCDAFLLPYNRKVWKRPLHTLAPSDFTWTITQPDFKRVLAGALMDHDDFTPYNAHAWYPRPPTCSPVRGMEVLSRALAERAHDLRLSHTVHSIDLERKTVYVRHGDRLQPIRFRKGCLSTIPLPAVIQMCAQAPVPMRRACEELKRNRVLSAAFSIRGPRPAGRGHWRYYANESIVFTRLIYMHEFDPHTAPADGWGLMAEIIERGEDPLGKPADILARAKADVMRVGALPDDCQIIDAHLLTADPAYVVFTPGNRPVMEIARRFLLAHDVTPLGRFGRWEYSSSAQAMRDGYTWAQQQLATEPARTLRSTFQEDGLPASATSEFA